MGIAASDRCASSLSPVRRSRPYPQPSRSNDSPSKRDALFFLANSTFKVYFAMSNLRLCDTILNNTQNASSSLDTHYAKADRVAFTYYRGRLSLYQRRLPQARNELRKAFALCQAESWGNARYVRGWLLT
jgi:hypothetical protein